MKSQIIRVIKLTEKEDELDRILEDREYDGKSTVRVRDQISKNYQ